MSSSSSTGLSWRGLVHLFIVYLVWSSTYLAIRVAVRPGAGFSPFSMAALRCLLACPLLLGWAFIRRMRIRPTWAELRTLVVSGILLWTFGNAFVVLAEEHVDSGLAAILIATTPIWVVLLESIADRTLPSPKVVAAVVVGFAGTALIAYPAVRSGGHALAFVLLLLASLSWGGGSLLQRRRPMTLDPLVSAAFQMLAGGTVGAFLSVLLGERLPHPTPAAGLAFAFLLVFGSILSFTSFLKALHLLPTRVVFTYAYVNPTIAAFLGWAVLGERLAPVTLVGAALVLLGVGGAFRARG